MGARYAHGSEWLGGVDGGGDQVGVRCAHGRKYVKLGGRKPRFNQGVNQCLTKDWGTCFG
jgi:hypothetical protein